MAERLPLSSLEAEIHNLLGGLLGLKMLWFYWNGNHYGIPFMKGAPRERHPKVGLIWEWVSGETINDLALSPSYMVSAPEEMRLHAFVRGGHLEVL